MPPPDTPEALNAELLARIVALERRIVEMQAKLAHHQSGRAASILATITANVRGDEMDDREFRAFVRRSVG